MAVLQKTALNMGNPLNGALIQLKRLVEKNISIDSSGFLQRHQIAFEIRGDAQGVRIKSTQIVCQTLDLRLRNLSGEQQCFERLAFVQPTHDDQPIGDAAGLPDRIARRGY